MPRYVYRCDSCEQHFQVRHGMSDKQESCVLCENAGELTRVPQMPSIKKESLPEKKKAGNITKDYIEDNRELLSEMKKEARGAMYES